MADSITFVGHSTLLIELAGTRLLTDPMLRKRVAVLRRLGPVPPTPGLLEPDAVLLSHSHLDHLDIRSLRKLQGSPKFVLPRGCAGFAARGGATDIVEIETGERMTIGPVEVEAVPALHKGRRHLITRPLPALGYVLRAGASIYFAGDTDIFDGMAAIGGGLDVALLPVAGWGRTLGPGHLDPERAAKAAALLKPRIAIPIHWGTLVGPTVRHAEAVAPPHEFARLAADLAPGVDVRVLQPGETLALN